MIHDIFLLLSLLFAVLIPSVQLPQSFQKGKCQHTSQLKWQIPLLLMYLSSFLYPPSLLKKTLVCFLFCFLAVRKALKMLLLPCHSIMLFGGRISWSHGKENCCPGSFILYSPYDSQYCIVPSQRGKIGLSCKSLVLFQAFVAVLKLLEGILLSAE